MTTFSDLHLDSKILTAIQRMGFETPSPVQQQAIPLILEGRDLMAQAETGTGKTAACAIPICQKINANNPAVQALIVVPTRELAMQYAAETQKIGRDMGVKAFAMFGGKNMRLQQERLKGGVQALVATPGRLIDFIRSNLIKLDQVKTLILDEADEMMSMGFYEDLKFILKTLTHDHQTLLFSATMPKEIRALAKTHMKRPAEIILTTERAGPEKLDHRFVYCPVAKGRAAVLETLIGEMETGQCLIFCRSRRQTEEVSRALRKNLEQVDYLHGGLTQPVRTRITNRFRKGAIRYLIATDVAARGLDFSAITHVFLFHLGEEVDDYMHRVGRAGRSGREGMAVTLVTDQELYLVPKILERIDREVQWVGTPPAKMGKPPAKARKSSARGPSKIGRSPSKAGKPSSNFGKPSAEGGKSTSKFGKGPSKFARPAAEEDNSPSKARRPYSKFGKGPAKFGKATSKFGKGPAKFGKATSKFGKGPAKFGKTTSKFGKGPAKFGKTTSKFGKGPAKFGKATSKFGKPFAKNGVGQETPTEAVAGR